MQIDKVKVVRMKQRMMMLKLSLTKKLLEKVQWEVKVECHEKILKTVEYQKCHQDPVQHQVKGVNLVLQDPDLQVALAVVQVQVPAAQVVPVARPRVETLVRKLRMNQLHLLLIQNQ